MEWNKVVVATDYTNSEVCGFIDNFKEKDYIRNDTWSLVLFLFFLFFTKIANNHAVGRFILGSMKYLTFSNLLNHHISNFATFFLCILAHAA